MISFPCDSHQSLVVRKVIGFTVRAARMSLHPADVSYSCGSCGYPLNLTSSDRITSGIGSEYRKSIKKGFISFLSVDRSRFTQVDQVSCFPVAWGCKRPKTKLLCRKCGVHIGYGYGDSLALCGFDSPNLSTSSYKKFTIKIRALQPSEDC